LLLAQLAERSGFTWLAISSGHGTPTQRILRWHNRNGNALSVVVPSDHEILSCPVLAVPPYEVAVIENLKELIKVDAVLPHFGISPVTEPEILNGNSRHCAPPFLRGCLFYPVSSGTRLIFDRNCPSRYTPQVPPGGP